jgi:dihydroorotase
MGASFASVRIWRCSPCLPDEPYVPDFALDARSKNSPFDEARMQGRVKLTIVGGEVVYEG